MTRPVRWGQIDTPDGPAIGAVTDAGVATLARGERVEAVLAVLERRFPGAALVHDSAALRDVAAWLDGFHAGSRRDLPGVDLAGLPAFDAAVYSAVREVPYGATATYGDIAAAIGVPAGARAVGGALGRCPLFPAVPCHRVVRAADGISGWGGDLRTKRRLLALERTGPPSGSSDTSNGRRRERGSAR